ncbi:unnamed protein product [Dovyalis caffra]|uniref:Uncharacterized protein n=1 Tax=Dovyalis caffra TaxID=77055 RepID=A0AAV1RH34_9ROSI|nr:unnamed protein product [Dovyalis caffra]
MQIFNTNALQHQSKVGLGWGELDPKARIWHVPMPMERHAVTDPFKSQEKKLKGSPEKLITFTKLDR